MGGHIQFHNLPTSMDQTKPSHGRRQFSLEHMTNCPLSLQVMSLVDILLGIQESNLPRYAKRCIKNVPQKPPPSSCCGLSYLCSQQPTFPQKPGVNDARILGKWVTLVDGCFLSLNANIRSRFAMTWISVVSKSFSIYHVLSPFISTLRLGPSNPP